MDRYSACQYASIRAHGGQRWERLARAGYRMFPTPQVTFLLAVDPAEAYRRIEQRGTDHETMGWLTAADTAYRALPEYPSFVVVDAGRPAGGGVRADPGAPGALAAAGGGPGRWSIDPPDDTGPSAPATDGVRPGAGRRAGPPVTEAIPPDRPEAHSGCANGSLGRHASRGRGILPVGYAQSWLTLTARESKFHPWRRVRRFLRVTSRVG